MARRNGSLGVYTADGFRLVLANASPAWCDFVPIVDAVWPDLPDVKLLLILDVCCRILNAYSLLPLFHLRCRQYFFPFYCLYLSHHRYSLLAYELLVIVVAQASVCKREQAPDRIRAFAKLDTIWYD